MQALQAFSLPGGRIVNLVEEIAFSWERVATQLKFSTAQIKKLQKNTANWPDPNGSACFEMLQDWLERDPDATWNILIRAIQYGCEDLTVLASEIEAALKSK